MGISFKNVGNAPLNVGGNYLRPGEFLCRLDRIKEGETRKGVGFIAFEMTVFHVFSGESHNVAENVTYMLMSDKDSFLSNWKTAIIGITDCPESDVTEELSQRILSDEQPLCKGNTVVRVSARNVETQAGKPFTVVRFEGEVPEEEWRPLVEGKELALNL